MTDKLTVLYEDWAKKAQEKVLVQARKDLAKGMDHDQVLEKMSRQLTNKLLHPVLASIRQGAEIDMEAFEKSRLEYFEKIKHIGPKSDHVQTNS